MSSDSTKFSIDFWSERISCFEKQISESGGLYPEEMSDIIHMIEAKTVKQSINIKKNFFLLDVGAGGGRWTVEFADNVHTIYAIEPSELHRILLKNTSQYNNVFCKKESIQKFQTDKKFDLIILSGVLLYVFEDNGVVKIIKKLSDLLNPGGFLFIRDAVSRRLKYMANWEEKSELAASDLGKYQYWEKIRAQEFYIDLCRSNHLVLQKSIISHAPFFYHTRIPLSFLDEIAKNILKKIVKKRFFPLVYAYNIFARRPYGIIRYALNLRSMKLFIFQKKT